MATLKRGVGTPRQIESEPNGEFMFDGTIVDAAVATPALSTLVDLVVRTTNGTVWIIDSVLLPQF